MASGETSQRRTRYARLYSNGDLAVMRAGLTFDAARQEMCGQDLDVEMLEVEITVIRTHGRPHIKAVTDRHINCPTCGEEIYVEETADGEIVQ